MIHSWTNFLEEATRKLTGINRADRRSPLLTLLAFFLFAAGGSIAIAQSVDGGFRDFGQEFGPTPSQLRRALSQLNDLQLQPSMMEQLMDIQEKIFSDLPADKQQDLMELAAEFMQKNQSGERPEIPQELSDYMKERLQRGDLPDSIKEFLKNPPANLNPSGSGAGNPPQPNAGGNPNSGNPSGDSQNDPRSGAPEGNQPPGNNGRDNSGQNPFENNSPGGGPDDAMIQNLLKRVQESIAGQSRGTEPAGPDETDPSDVFEIAEPEFDDATETEGSLVDPGDGASDDGESVGTRIDRIIMDVVENQLGDQEAGGESRFAGINSFLEGVVEKVHSRITEGDTEFSFDNGSLSHRMREHMNAGSGGNGGGEGIFSTLSQLSKSSASSANTISNISWWWLGGMAIVLVGLMSWLGLRIFAVDDVESGSVFKRQRYRLRKIRTAEDLVRQVDGYLLATFGKPSSWWHSRRAEVALNKDQPHLASGIRELVDCYEFARYSEVGGSLSDEQIQQCVVTLRELVSAKPATAASVAVEGI